MEPVTLHVVTATPRPTLPCTGGYRCTCPSCDLERQHAIALAGHRDKPQPWHTRIAA